MRCAYHLEVDAIGVCVNCGRAVCVDCRLLLSNKTYCQTCADETFAKKSAPITTKGRSGILTAGGILGIIGGTIGLLYALALASGFIIEITDSGSSLSNDDPWDTASKGIAAMVFIFLATMELVGGILALKRKRFKLALFGAVCGIICVSSMLLGILATIFIATSKNEFDQRVDTTNTEYHSAETMGDALESGLGIE